ncbi:TIGR03619 family F420-dependent LLM class oxidoreductase [Mycolicibacterium sp. P9-64]|uniref:LLM class flavin-dependent oxidoreductase n=1 Tax=Mycolicibacterium sp. P9-64 TaxID=2024612 RepID=UPI0011EC1434|nr:TIGR03619 family F420-dependent LLM class oxidoreductase [Mycolicibacterium sp. P9-64]KAA0081718.1 TIGR03619 family F420-dependent LLM class oxidoreductase [Mycolicibacterium sp. P9-64]
MSATFGLAVENFTSAQKTPQIDELLVTARRAEQLGFTSLWAWDHLFLGSRQPFPQLEALTTLAVLASHTTTIELGTGVLVLPIRDPALLAKTAATIQAISNGRLRLGLAAGWYEREFDATGTPFKDRGRIFERNLEICMDLWTQDEVTDTWDDLSFRRVKMLPLPQPRPQVLIGGYVDRVLKRVGTLGDGWLTYFYTPEAFTKSWNKIARFADDAGRDPAELHSVNQLPICIAPSKEKAQALSGPWLASYFDTPEWSSATPDSAICGTPEDCAEQIAAHLDAGVKEICLIPHEYDSEQMERCAAEVLPLVGATVGAA